MTFELKSKLNAHRLLRGGFGRSGFIKALDVPKPQEDRLIDAQNAVRDELRREVPRALSQAAQRNLVTAAFVKHADQLKGVTPKFRRQGSSVYKTLNDPAQSPPQQVDYDDGMFLPVSFFTNNGARQEPLLAAKAYFREVERILEGLCKRKGWALKPKDSCIRIQIDDKSHLDLALYAVPDDDFIALAKATARPEESGLAVAAEAYEFAEAVYERLPDDRIVLAHRKDGWVESDPRKLDRWFRRAVAELGPGDVIARLCRYLKAWRDFTWEEGGPASIALMACVIRAVEELGGDLPAQRDDLALQVVVDRLPELLGEPVWNPVIKGKRLDEGWSDMERQEFIAYAYQLRDEIDQALNSVPSKTNAVARFRGVFGPRVPNDPDAVEIDKAPATVQSYASAAAPLPFVNTQRTTAG